MKGIAKFIPSVWKKIFLNQWIWNRRVTFFSSFLKNYYFILFWILDRNNEGMPSRDGLALLRMSSDHSLNSLTKEAGKVLTQTMRAARKTQNQCQQQILHSWQVLALRMCIYIRTMQINPFFLTIGSNMRLKKQIFQLMAIFYLNFAQVLLINTVIRALCRYFGWGLHVKAQISAAKEENYHQYGNHGENEKEMDRKQRTQHSNCKLHVLEINQAFADFKDSLGYLI